MGPLSTTIITCSSPVQWSMNVSQSSTVNQTHDKTVLTRDVTTKKFFIALKNLYVLRIVAKEFDTYVNIYISTETGGPQALRKSHQQKLRLQRRQKGKRLTIRWDASLVDPQGTDYCLTVSPVKSYKTLCSAEAEKFGVVPPTSIGHLSASQTMTTYQPKHANDQSEKPHYPLIACVGRKRQYTVSNLKQGQTYFFDLFATNKQSNLTYLFGSTSTKFDSRVKPTPLRNGKSTFVNLRKFDGKIVFKFKIGKTEGNHVNIFIIPCGAVIDAEVTLMGKTVGARERIEKFSQIILHYPTEGERYNIKIEAVNVNRDDLGRNSGVEVFATWKPTFQIPFPHMPTQKTVHEYESLRTCNSVTVGWLRSTLSPSVYCVVVMEGKIRDLEGYGVSSQCGLDSKLRNSVNFGSKSCKNFSQNYTNNVITEKINNLLPGKSYIVEVTVKKPRGKSIAYDLLQVHTTPTCLRH